MKRKHDKELEIPKEGTVSELKVSYKEAKDKREETKQKYVQRQPSSATPRKSWTE